MPLPFYLTCMALAVLAVFAWNGRQAGWGLPAGMVLATVGVWYVGDVLYNDFGDYLATLGVESLTSALWQVLWFVVCFGVLLIPVHRMLNRQMLEQRSHIMSYMESGRLQDPEVQQRITKMGRSLLAAWLVLMGIGLYKVEGNAVGLFAPYLSQKIDPWGRGQIGGGFSALLSLAAYFHIFLASAFGVLLAISFNRGTRGMAFAVCLLTLPFFLFDRTRNTMLATVLPGVLAYTFLRVQGSLLKKGAVLAGFFLVVNSWFLIVMANRSGMSFDILGALSSSKETTVSTKHEGLNMLEELAWIDNFIETNAYMPNHGERYFAELVNPIPRALWPGKPMIGLDYAVARGQGVTGELGETTATISTGMIGQGVVNFGRILGPAAAALLMALWVAVLARQDLLGDNPARLLLYSCGLILTFNLGRDITLLVLYPFVFGWMAVRFIEGKELKERKEAL
jgi:hypothetical protein